MKLIRITQKNDFAHMKSIYLEAFPRQERPPYWLLQKRALQGKADFWGLAEDGGWAGMAYVIPHGNLAYLYYFAIDRRLRGRHYGTQALRLLLETYAQATFFLALEDWREDCKNPDQRKERHAFYQKCGLIDLPHKISEMGVPFAIMGNASPVKPEEYAALMDAYAGAFLKPFLRARMLEG